jgi:hypothetical protein
MDLVIASDGIFSWNLDSGEQQAALRELRRITRADGALLLTEHARKHRFPEFLRQIERSGLRIVWVRYLYDRPWYQIESWFKAVQHWRWVQAARSSVAIARGLCMLGDSPIAAMSIARQVTATGVGSDSLLLRWGASSWRTRH